MPSYLAPAARTLLTAGDVVDNHVHTRNARSRSTDPHSDSHSHWHRLKQLRIS